MKKSVNLIDRTKRNVINLFFLLAAIVAAGLGPGVKKADATLVTGFADLVGTAGTFNAVEHFIEFQPPYGYDNLMIRDSNGVDSVVSKTGTDVWRIGFAKYDGANLNFGGYVNNDNNLSNDNPNVLGGWCGGFYTNTVLPEGSFADEVVVIHDQNGDGIGDVTGGVWTLGADDVVYWTEDIEFNGVQGDINELGPFNYIDTKILPQMTINPVTARSPVPGDNAKDIDLNVELSWAGAYGAVHNVYFGSDPNNLGNVSLEQPESVFNVEGLNWASTYYWRVDEVDSEGVVHPGRIWSFDTINDCSSSIVGDLNGDCVVDFEDFALMVKNWLNCTRLGTGACP